MAEDRPYTVAQKLLDQKLTVKEIYAKLISKHFEFKEVISKWENDGITVDWDALCNKSSKLINGDLKNFFLRFNVRSFVLNNVLHHYVAVSLMCTFCKKEKETYTHLYWFCPKIQAIWHYVHSLVSPESKSLSASLLLGQASTKDLFLLTLCKYYLHVCRIRCISPKVKHFKNRLNFQLKATKATLHLAKKDTIFEKMWGNLYCILNR